ncbi:hypothetical protein B0H19DRAFT_1261963 [Mycena capillaripes]|nr:hypothetical protein B0H19DRAFT_1261963 [Mycena capillaripes]
MARIQIFHGPPGTTPHCSIQSTSSHGSLFKFPERCFSDDSEWKPFFTCDSEDVPFNDDGAVWNSLCSFGGCSNNSGLKAGDEYPTVVQGPAFRLRGDDSDVVSNGPKRKRKITTKSKPRKRVFKGAESDSDSELGIRVTAKSEKRSKGGIFVDQLIYLDGPLESYNVPASTNRVAYIMDIRDQPELLTVGPKQLTVDGLLKKECQDPVLGPTGAKAVKTLAKVVILDSDEPILCRRSYLTCSGIYKCTLSATDFLDNCRRWDDTDETHPLVSAPIMEAKASEATSVAALASAFYRGVTSTYCKGKYLDSEIACGGRAIIRKFSQGKMNGKIYFIGCSNWASDDSEIMSKIHRFTKVPANVRESILIKLFKGEVLSDEDDDTEVLAGSCQQIIHPSHLPGDSICPRNHFKNGVHTIAPLEKRKCTAKLTVLIPIDEMDLRVVIIPLADVPHNHPSFPRSKVPVTVKQKYYKCIDSAGIVGTTTLRVDKASSTLAILGGKLPQEFHPSLINNRNRRDMVKDHRGSLFPEGTGLLAIYSEFDRDRARDIKDRYIHAVTTRADDLHVIITINPELATLVLDAIWIMVDTTFAVVHGKTNEWKLVIWLNSIDRRTVIGRVWSNGASRGAFVLVWGGIFDAIETITGKKINFKTFSPQSKLLGVIGDSEGAQAQGLGDVIILRHMNLLTIGKPPAVDVDSILMLIWKTCIVHFNRGVFGLKTYIDELDLTYLLGFPYLCSDEEIQEYYTFCAESSNVKVKAWWTHKLSYPWLLPSLNRELSQMNNRHWDLTPRDTNPIEGSHAQDNQVNSTHRSLLEAILLAKKLDGDTARVIKATMSSGVFENPNNSLEARFKSQSQRQIRSKEKQHQLESLTGRDAKKLRSEVKMSKQKSREDALQILKLQRQIDALTQRGVPRAVTPPSHAVARPSRINAVAGPSRLNSYNVTPSEEYIDVDEYSPPPSFPMRALNLFPGLPPLTPRQEPRSDFDYPGALASEVLDRTLRKIEEEHPMHPVNGDDEVLASDPYPVFR